MDQFEEPRNEMKDDSGIAPSESIFTYPPKFEKAEVMVKFKCDVHPWMSAYAGILDHPFFAVTNEEGAFEIKDLPPGNYVIEAWHEKYGVQTQNVTIAEGAAATTDFSFAG